MNLPEVSGDISILRQMRHATRPGSCVGVTLENVGTLANLCALAAVDIEHLSAALRDMTDRVGASWERRDLASPSEVRAVEAARKILANSGAVETASAKED